MRRKTMLRDFLLLESYFGEPDSIQAIEDTVRRYGPDTVREAVEAGHLKIRALLLRTGGGPIVCGLSESGRRKACAGHEEETPDPL